jgi:hypothetical protein
MYLVISNGLNETGLVPERNPWHRDVISVAEYASELKRALAQGARIERLFSEADYENGPPAGLMEVVELLWNDPEVKITTTTHEWGGYIFTHPQRKEILARGDNDRAKIAEFLRASRANPHWINAQVVWVAAFYPHQGRIVWKHFAKGDEGKNLSNYAAARIAAAIDNHVVVEDPYAFTIRANTTPR